MKKILVGIIIASLIAFNFPHSLNSANLTSVADTLSTSRLSYYNKLAVLHTTGVTSIQVATSGMPSKSTANLFTGDSVLIGDGATATTYTVDDIIDTDEFQITAGLGANDAAANELVIATRSAKHTVTFTPATKINGGGFRILIPSGANGVNDGIPNHDGFDFNGIGAAQLTAPTGGGVDSWTAATATAAGATGCAAGYHCFETQYKGVNNNSGTFTFVIGNDGANDLINPAKSGSTEGSADGYTVVVQHLDSPENLFRVVDSTNIKIAVVESVRVSATVDPTITFTVAAVTTGDTACGANPDVTSTATTVPFGTMALNTFKNLAQKLTLSTNAAGGAVVTAAENDHLGKNGETTPFIPDASGDGAGTMTEAVTEDWETATNNGFGFSLDDAGDGAADVTEALAYNVASGNCANGVYCAREFANLAHADSATQIFNTGSTVVDAGDLYVCYRLSVGSTQAAGDYENNITYTATATF